MQETLFSFPLPFMLPSTVIIPLLCLVSGHDFQESLTQSCLKMRVGSGVDQTTSFPDLHACTASPDSEEEQLTTLLQYCCCSRPSAASLSGSCEPGCQEGAKAKQTDTATFLTCSRTHETGLCVVKVLIRPISGNLKSNTATFLTQSMQQSFVSEKSQGGSFEATRLDFRKSSMLRLKCWSLIRVSSPEKVLM